MKQPEADTNKLLIALIIGVVVLLLSLYGAYKYSQMYPSEIVLPGGVTYLGPSPTPNP